MNKLEKLIALAEELGCKVWDRKVGELEGLYVDDNIALSPDIETTNRKCCVLAEEIGHHKYTVGDISDQTKIENRKQERVARKWAYHKLLPIDAIKHALEMGYTEVWEIADYFDADEQFVEEALIEYKLLDK